MELSRDVLEFIQLLNQKKVEFLVIGGWAVGFHGRPRYTKDIDILINPTPQNAKRVVEVLVAFGFGSLDISESDFLTPGQIIQLGMEPNRIDLLTSVPGLQFDQAYQNRQSLVIKGIEIIFIGKEDLIMNKSAVGRPQDLADVAFLKRAPSKSKSDK